MFKVSRFCYSRLLKVTDTVAFFGHFGENRPFDALFSESELSGNGGTQALNWL